MPIEAPDLNGISRRLAEIRRSSDFNGDARLKTAIEALEVDYGNDGIAAADILRKQGGLAGKIDELAIRYLVPLRLHSRKSDPHATGFKLRLQRSRPSWRLIAFDIRKKPKQPGPDKHAVFDHPEFLKKPPRSRSYAYLLANATASEIAMDLAEAYDADRKTTRYRNESRSLELDDIIVALGPELLNFAKFSVPDGIEKHRKVANAYRRFEDVAEAVRGEALVVEGRKAFESEEEEKQETDVREIEGVNGKTVTTTQVRQFIRTIGTLPAYGDWNRSELPSRTVAMARAVQGLGLGGITFTLNLHAVNFGRFQGASRKTHSAIQDQLYKSLKKAFGQSVDFYFVLEQGVDESPHLHGAIALDPTEANLEAVKACLKRLGRADQKRKAPERLVKVDPLYTPGRWGGYAVKASNVSAIRSGVENTLCATQGLKRQAKVEWELMRAEQRDAKKVLRETRTAA
jgi:hypothetical protein